MTKKLDNLIEAGKEKLKAKKWRKIGIVALFNTVVGLNINH